MGILSRIKNKLLPKVEPAPVRKAAPPAPPSPATPGDLQGNLAKDGEKPWYLDGQDDVDGWDSTDVKK